MSTGFSTKQVQPTGQNRDSFAAKLQKSYAEGRLGLGGRAFFMAFHNRKYKEARSRMKNELGRMENGEPSVFAGMKRHLKERRTESFTSVIRNFDFDVGNLALLPLKNFLMKELGKESFNVTKIEREAGSSQNLFVLNPNLLMSATEVIFRSAHAKASGTPVAVVLEVDTGTSVTLSVSPGVQDSKLVKDALAGAAKRLGGTIEFGDVKTTLTLHQANSTWLARVGASLTWPNAANYGNIDWESPKA
ncbi:MAG: hypothetical protein WC717_04605 [Candidatus Micrarchaeia archaeon]|jgi:hypothetical protein